ncbi:esterase/lipase family protein [Amycolatopsis ruanii]|uniref:esterase/lipase family protein n=1 Tax=Amycolatopsis ruanii TaxID=944491 RepID=UPI000E27FC20|nr:alpha/beta fold hydrolase [Amycolatopsis ruanii]
MRAVFTALAAALLTIAAAPAASAAPTSGFGDWSCRPSAAHPEPVVLLHGLGGNGPGNFAYLGPYLAQRGYCAFTLTYGQAVPEIPVGGTIAIEDSAREIEAFVDRVRETTGAERVDLVGHSEGGFHALYGPKVLGYAGEVLRVVALAPPTDGTTFGGLVTVADHLGLRPSLDPILATFGCPACAGLITGGEPVADLTDGPIAQDGVAYTILATRFDALVTPHETSFVREPGVRNAFVQDTCPADPVGHVGMAFDTAVAGLVANALDPEHPAPVLCTPGLPF